MTPPPVRAARRFLRLGLAGCVTLLAGALLPTQALSQTGAGTTTAAVLQLPGGGRAAGMAGAYVAGTDGDGIFYNPAAAAWLRAAAGLSYQRHVDQIGFGSAGAALRVRRPTIMLSLGFLDYGSIAEVVPDPLFGGQRGEETGRQIDASELAGKVGAGLRLGRRAAIGGTVGVMYANLAETGRLATVFDLGAQYRLMPQFTLGAALRNLGPDLDGARLGAAPLPSELRAGAAWTSEPLVQQARLTVHADAVAPLNDGTAGVVIGLEAAVPLPQSGFSAAVRAGYDGTHGSGGLGRLRLGAGLAHGAFSLDYAFQDMDVLGTVHRFGMRWNR